MRSAPDIVLPISRHRLTFMPVAAGRWPRYPGSVWRGGFGHALKRVVCVMRMQPCEACPLKQSCLYPTVFETGPGEAAIKMRRYERVPHPYILQPARMAGNRLEPGLELSLDVTLVGRAAQHVGYVVRALQEAASGGLGPDRTASEFVSVAPLGMDRPPWLELNSELRPGLLLEAVAPAIPACPRTAQVEMTTPLRIQREGQLVGPLAFVPADMLRSLVRRVSMLTTFFTDAPLDADFRALTQMASTVAMPKAELQWIEITRRSSRQQTVMQMGGIVGRFDIVLAGAEALWPFLWLGQWIGAGKGATMGLGEYRIEPARADA